MEIKDGGILIIASPRSGSSNLLSSIGSAYNKKTRFEYDIIRKHPYYNPNKDVLKCIPVWEKDPPKILDSFLYDKLLESAREFNTIILLDRKDKLKQLESYYVLRRINEGNHLKKWGREQINRDDEHYKLFERYINSFTTFFEKISNDLNLPIDYHEDVYKNKSLTNKNIKLDLKYFESNYKLRQPIIERKLL